jgi:hypothetical protein
MSDGMAFYHDRRGAHELTEAEREAYAEAVDRRNEAIQRVCPRPVDGVTFGTGKPPKPKDERA